ncbi:hypothetical protein [Lederbergia lenta]|uniref:hypothetical protein n=1 Tax=Lederbergia lenta TaxID=1467 RepID=UPI00203A4B38|nr:hypothetical protein [Lederbergia lenta]MCM3113614.1 hypothetical protein [Lederbergia lenta]
MTEKELDALINELENDKFELTEFISNHLEDATDKDIDALATDLYTSPLDLREFVIHALNI